MRSIIPLFVCALLASCKASDDGPNGADADADADADTDADSDSPELLSLTAQAVADNPELYLAWQVDVTADRPVRATFDIEGGGVHRVVAFEELAETQTLPLLGLRFATDYTLTVSVTDDAGAATTAEPIAVRTGDRPTRLPDIDVLISEPARIFGAYTLLDARTAQDFCTSFILDDEYQVVWALQGLPQLTDSEIDAAGTLWLSMQASVVAFDLLGNVTAQWGGPQNFEPYIAVDAENLNHEVVPDGEGGFWSIDQITIQVPEYPTSYTDPTTLTGPVSILDPSIVHVTADGVVDLNLSMAERLQTDRIGFNALDQIRNGVFDWAHANSLSIDPAGGFLIGLKDQDAVVDFDENGELRWILGDHAGWSEEFQPYLLTPVGDLRWQYHMHGSAFQPDGSVAVFDNGNFGHTPYTPAPSGPITSRAVGYRVDPDAMTVTMEWERDNTAVGPLFSQSMSGVDLLPNGGIFASYGWVPAEAGVTNADNGWGTNVVHLVEWAPDDPVNPVLDLRLHADIADLPAGYLSYRADRMTSIYPSVGPWRATETWPDR